MWRQARSRALWASTSNFLFIPSYSGCWSTLTRLILQASFDRLDSHKRGKDDGDLIRMKLLWTAEKMGLAANALKSLMLDNVRHGRKSIFCKRDVNNWIYLMSNRYEILEYITLPCIQTLESFLTVLKAFSQLLYFRGITKSFIVIQFTAMFNHSCCMSHLIVCFHYICFKQSSLFCYLKI